MAEQVPLELLQAMPPESELTVPVPAPVTARVSVKEVVPVPELPQADNPR